MPPSLGPSIPKLPNELIEKIFSAHVENFDQDPAYQWTVLRHLSPHQKRRIEHGFQQDWLQKHLIITIYSGAWNQVDYKFAGFADSDMVRFRWDETEESRRASPERWAEEVWGRYGFENRIAHLRLGQGVFYNGLGRAYIINDTEIVGLQVHENGKEICFQWRETLNDLLREEMFMRKATDKIIEAKKDKLGITHVSPSTLAAVPPEQLIKFLDFEVQMSRRVATYKHRAMRHDPTGETAYIFPYETFFLHRQPVQKPEQHSGRSCCGICSRRRGPDIFEVVLQEETMLPLLPLFAGWLSGQVDDTTLFELSREEFGWTCCIMQGRVNEADFQQQRAKVINLPNRELDADQWHERIRAELYSDKRWDPLG